MDPRGYVAQAVLSCLATGLCAFSAAWWLGLTLAAVHLLFWALFNRRYARALDGRNRSRERADGDRRVATAALVSTVTAVAISVAVGLAGPRLTTDRGLSVAIGGLASIPTIMSMSTLVDWYFIRSRRDGVIGLPPCLRDVGSENRAHWQWVTRMWFLHRSLTIVLVLISTVTMITAFTFGLIDLEAAAQGAVLASVLATTLVVVQIIYDLRSLSTATTQNALRPPDIVLGDVVRSNAAQANGFVVDVAVEGVSMIRRPGAESRRRTLIEMQRDASVEIVPFRDCRPEHCTGIIPTCQRSAHAPPERRSATRLGFIV